LQSGEVPAEIAEDEEELAAIEEEQAENVE